MALSQEDADRMQEEISQLKKKLQEEKDRRAGEQQRLKERTRETFQKMKDECNSQVAKLNSELQEARQQVEAKGSAEAKANDALIAQTRQAKELEAKLEQASKSVKESPPLVQHESQALELKSQVSELEEKLQASKQERANSIQEVVNKAKERCQEFATRNRELEDGRKELQERLQAEMNASQELKEFATETANYKEQLFRVQEELSKSKEQVLQKENGCDTEKEQELKKFSDEVQRLEQVVEQQSTALNKSTEIADQKSAEISGLQVKLGEISRDKDDVLSVLQQQESQLQAQLHESSIKYNSLHDESQQAAECSSNLRAEILQIQHMEVEATQQSKENCAVVQRELDEMRHEMKEKLTLSEASCAQGNSELESLQVQSSELRQTLDACKLSLSQQEQSAAVAETSARQHLEKAEQLEKDVAELRPHQEAALKTGEVIASLTTEMKQLETKLTQSAQYNDTTTEASQQEVLRWKGQAHVEQELATKAQAKSEQLQEEHSKLQCMLSACRDSLRQQEHHAEAAEKSARAKQEEVEQMQHDSADLVRQKEYAQQSEEVAQQLQAEISNLQARLVDSAEKCARGVEAAHGDVERWKTQADLEEEEARNAKLHQDSLRTECSELSNMLEACQTSLSHHEHNAEGAESSARLHFEKAEQLEKDVAELRPHQEAAFRTGEAIEELREEIKQLEVKLAQDAQQTEASSEAAQQKVQSCREQLHLEKQVAANMQEVTEQMRQETSELQGVLQECQASLKQQVHRAGAAEHAARERQEEIEHLQSSNAALSSQREHAQQSEETIQKLQAEISNLQTQLGDSTERSKESLEAVHGDLAMWKQQVDRESEVARHAILDKDHLRTEHSELASILENCKVSLTQREQSAHDAQLLANQHKEEVESLREKNAAVYSEKEEMSNSAHGNDALNIELKAELKRLQNRLEFNEEEHQKCLEEARTDISLWKEEHQNEAKTASDARQGSEETQTKLQHELTVLSQRLHDSDSDAAKARAEFSQLSEQLSKAESVVNQEQLCADQAEKAVAVQKEEIERALQSSIEARSSHELSEEALQGKAVLVDNLEQEIARLRERLPAKDSQIELLTTKLEHSCKQLAIFESDAAGEGAKHEASAVAAKHNVEQLQIELAKMQESTGEHSQRRDQHIHNLQEELQASCSELNTAELQMQTKLEAVVETTRAHYDEEIRCCLQGQSEKAMESECLHRDLSDLKGKVAEFTQSEDEARNAQEENTRLKATITELQGQLIEKGAVTADAQQLSATANEMQLQLHKAIENEACSEQSVADLRSQIESMQCTSIAERQRCEDAEFKMQHLQDQLHHVQEQHKSAEQAVELLNAQQLSAEAEIERLQYSLPPSENHQTHDLERERHLQSEVEQLQAEKADSDSKSWHLQEEMSTLRRDLVAQQHQVEEAEHHKQQLQSQIGTLQASVELARAEGTQAAALEREVISLQSQLATMKEQAAPAQDVGNRVCELEKRLASVEQERQVAVQNAFAAGRKAEQELLANKHTGDQDTTISLERRIEELELQLSRAEGSSAALQDAAARAAERLQVQALRERELEERLAQASTIETKASVVQMVMDARSGIRGICRAATGRCRGGRQGYEQPPSPPPMTPPAEHIHSGV